MSMAGHFSHAFSLALLVATTLTGGLLAMTTSTTTSIPTSSAGQDSSCPPGMVCIHGYCPAGSVSCVCHPGWAGFQCEQACPADCNQNAACQTTPEGTPYCLCDDGLRYVNGRGCVNGTITTASPTNGDTSVTRSPNQTDAVSLSSGHTTATPTQAATRTGPQSEGVTTLRPVAERTCVPGFVCHHGQCAPDTIRCDCDEGWSGAFCSERCSKNCSEHGRCMVQFDGTSYCSCDWFYTGELCEVERMVPSAAADPASSATTTTAPVNDSMRSLEERTCVPGFVCLHGRCAPSPTLACECDSGWAGAFCHQPCTLDCGPLGRCYTTGVGQELTMHCSCAGGYSGPRCQTSHLNDTAPDVDEGPATSVDWDVTDDLRPLSERQCVVGFVCLHGACKEEGIECQCDSGWIGVFCHQPCPMNCVHGECRVHSNGSVQCNCEPEYTGVNCTEKRKFPEVAMEDDTVQWIVVGVCGGLLLVLLVLLVVLPYWMWKRGHIFIMKIVYHFKSFEDDDKKLYDAFISYSRMDDDFVVQQLFPKLTEMKFKVCVHKKDFIPGETIANNIIEAVENSRRTILVVSPDFIHSEFCRFEYQQAQYEMIKRRQRIVPVVLRDVTKEKKNMDATLRSILETITYLDWPEDGDPRKVERFWKRLELSMPKRKSRPESSASQYTSAYSRLDSTSSGYSSCSSKAGGKTTTTSSTSSLGSHSAVQQQAKKSRSSRSSQSKSSRDSRPAKRGRHGNGGSSSSTSASWSKSKATDLDSVTIEMERHDRKQRGCAGYTNGYNNAAYSLK